jgi:hypothetical protein
MKIVSIVVLSFLALTFLQAQDAGTKIPSSVAIGMYGHPYMTGFSLSSYSRSALAQSKLGDTALYNMYGNLRDDNPVYNQKSPWWMCGVRAVGNNVVMWAFDRFVLKADFSTIGFNSWKHNMATGWEWDTDRFGMNFFLHPYSGDGYFNSARANGYSFYESVPFAFGGSLMWEYFGENTLPSWNDLINTTANGAFLGEISYRLSSDFLDDRTTGAERTFRELFAAIINPSRAFSRLTQGKLTRVTSEEIYQKEPLDMTFAAGAHLVNDGSKVGTGHTSEMLVLLLNYGDPYEQRSRKPFDYFRLRADLVFGMGRKIIDNVIGEGILYGKNVHSGNFDMLIGGFQHYDYWDNTTFELGTIAFGGGMISKLQVSARSDLRIEAHLGIVPLAGNSTVLGPDTSQFRDYNYGGGAQAKLVTSLNLGGWASLAFRGNYYWVQTYVGTAGNNYIGIIRPSVTFRIFNNLSLGAEHLVYYSDRFPRDFPYVHVVRTEQKIFLQLYIENFARAR